jgi:uncharacterized protein
MSSLAVSPRRAIRRSHVIALGALVLLTISAGCNHAPAPTPPDQPSAQPAPRPDDGSQRLPTATIRLGDRPLVVEVARTEAERQTGMMHRKKLGPDEAMLFVFQRAENLSFWMKNTLVDLDLAYITAEGRIDQVEHLKAQDLTSVDSREPVLYALELPAGWLKAHGFGVGTMVTVPPEVNGK